MTVQEQSQASQILWCRSSESYQWKRQKGQAQTGTIEVAVDGQQTIEECGNRPNCYTDFYASLYFLSLNH